MAGALAFMLYALAVLSALGAVNTIRGIGKPLPTVRTGNSAAYTSVFTAVYCVVFCVTATLLLQAA